MTELTGAATDAETITLPTVEATLALGERLGREVRAGDVVVLTGPLGAGKTVLARGIARGMDVEGPIISPTFVLARVHRAREPGRPSMVHVDVYRLREGGDLLAELDSLDIDTDLDEAVAVVEWGEGLAERLAQRHLDVTLQRVPDSDIRTATWRWSRR
ncbi:MAG: tRNA (adenosine(37)-N6)-threonylcarbamoyltransferase complex ATPase subunit type 1 TsaE [Mycobacteriaceae bacterium]|nr:tRNA (adenosine(37)-N6)-threonylcarbamoyltransferase complex ATPase subunit type 1 TsaE [Mycobacteriaceae bacterium]